MAWHWINLLRRSPPSESYGELPPSVPDPVSSSAEVPPSDLSAFDPDASISNIELQEDCHPGEQSEQPRSQHYSLAHILLPDLLFEDPSAFFKVATSPIANQWIHHVWHNLGSRALASRQSYRISAEGLSLDVRVLN